MSRSAEFDQAASFIKQVSKAVYDDLSNNQ
jgi:hypothetical protein